MYKHLSGLDTERWYCICFRAHQGAHHRQPSKTWHSDTLMDLGKGRGKEGEWVGKRKECCGGKED